MEEAERFRTQQGRTERYRGQQGGKGGSREVWEAAWRYRRKRRDIGGSRGI